jgi:catechol 2,3-dioxygenase-like lactoylglutathione lyase family enzyme
MMMSVRRIVPDIRSSELDASRRFYEEVIGLQVAMDLGFVMTLVSPSNPTAQLTLMRGDDQNALQRERLRHAAGVGPVFVGQLVDERVDHGDLL